MGGRDGISAPEDCARRGDALADGYKLGVVRYVRYVRYVLAFAWKLAAKYYTGAKTYLRYLRYLLVGPCADGGRVLPVPFFCAL